jgi:hypothetical protein
MMAPEPISTAYFINPSHQSLCLYMYVARQRLAKNVTAPTNTHTTIYKLLDSLFCVRSVSYKRKVGDYFFLELLVWICLIYFLLFFRFLVTIITFNFQLLLVLFGQHHTPTTLPIIRFVYKSRWIWGQTDQVGVEKNCYPIGRHTTAFHNMRHDTRHNTQQDECRSQVALMCLLCWCSVSRVYNINLNHADHIARCGECPLYQCFPTFWFRGPPVPNVNSPRPP